MSMDTMNEFLADNGSEILAAAQKRMRTDVNIDQVSAQSEISTSDLAAQVLGFWLKAIRTDLELGSTAVLEQNLKWLVKLRTGHSIPFDDAMVGRTFEYIAVEIDSRLESDELRNGFSEYREKANQLIGENFPTE